MGGVGEPSRLAVRLWYAFRARDWETVGAMLHPDAQIETALATDRALGRKAMVELWRSAVEEGRYNPKPVGFIDLDSDRVLLLGALKPTRSVSQADALVLTFKDDLLWRARYYDTVEEAQASSNENTG